MIKKNLIWLLLFFFGFWLLSACQSAPPVTHYLILSEGSHNRTSPTLSPQRQPQDQLLPQNSILKKSAITIDKTQSAASLKTKKMEYKRNPHEIEYYTQSEWAVEAPRMIQDLVVETLLESGRFQDVISGPHHLKTPLRLELYLYRLRQDFTTQPYHATVRLQARLLDTSSSQLIFSHTYQDNEPIMGYNADEGVKAFNRLFSRLLPRLQADLIR